MKTIILAAGKGTRLKPHTDDKPKCLVELLGRPLLDHQIDVLKSCGLTDIHVVAGYLANKISRLGLKVHLNKKFSNTNMVYTLFCAADELDGKCDVIIAYGDIVYERCVLQELILADDPINLVIDKEWLRYWNARMGDPLQDAETLKINSHDRIIEIGKKPKSLLDVQGQYTGLIKVRADYVAQLKDVWKKMDKQKKYDGQDYENMYMTSFLQHLIDIKWPVRAVYTKNRWAEIDTDEDLKIAPLFWQPRLS